MRYNIELRTVEFMPKVLDDHVLYVSDRFKIATHMCPCGCRNKIVTPLGPYEWSISVKKGKPTLLPSIGNWQIPCRSHYWIKNGQVEWSYSWTDEEVKAGRRKEQAALESYFQRKVDRRKTPFRKRIKIWIQNFKKGLEQIFFSF